MRKKTAISGAIFLCVLALSAGDVQQTSQKIQHEAIVINIEVPVRVYKGNTFIDNLTIDDFEIYEEGILQKAEAMYLVKKTNIEREETTAMDTKEARKRFAPRVARNFVFLFEIHEFLPRIGTAIEYFFDEVFLPEDSLTLVTPQKTYHFDNRALEKYAPKEIAQQFIGQLRADVRMSTVEYRSLLNDLVLVENFEKDAADPDVEDLVRSMHSNIVGRLRNLRYLDENKMLEFAASLENTEGPKHVFFFLQKLQVPIIRYNPVFGFDDLEEFEAYSAVDEDKIKRIFSSSSITAHMIYITKITDTGLDWGGALTAKDEYDTEQTTMPREIQDISANFFSSFKDIADATGGIVESSTNAAASFKKTMQASEQYYLLYYTPQDYRADGLYKEIKVRIKGQNYRISHRAGYIAD